MEEPIAKRLRSARKGEIDLTPLSNRISELLAQRNESLRAAGLKAGLDHQFVRRIVNGERQHSCSSIFIYNLIAYGCDRRWRIHSRNQYLKSSLCCFRAITNRQRYGGCSNLINSRNNIYIPQGSCTSQDYVRICYQNRVA